MAKAIHCHWVHVVHSSSLTINLSPQRRRRSAPDLVIMTLPFQAPSMRRGHFTSNPHRTSPSLVRGLTHPDTSLCDSHCIRCWHLQLLSGMSHPLICMAKWKSHRFHIPELRPSLPRSVELSTGDLQHRLYIGSNCDCIWPVHHWHDIPA